WPPVAAGAEYQALAVDLIDSAERDRIPVHNIDHGGRGAGVPFYGEGLLRALTGTHNQLAGANEPMWSSVGGWPPRFALPFHGKETPVAIHFMPVRRRFRAGTIAEQSCGEQTSDQSRMEHWRASIRCRRRL